PARTPWDLTRSAGGSSGGAAAAVAAGLAPLAQGSDGGGSVRIPASVCGLYGIKVSRGRVSNGPFRGDVSGLSWIGPIARTVRDAAALLDVMAVPMPGDPHWAPPLPAGQSFLAAADRDPGRLRVGRYVRPGVLDAPVHPDVLAAWEEASGLLVELGHEVVDIDPPLGPEVLDTFLDVWAVLTSLTPVPAGTEELLMPLTRWWRERGDRISGTAYARAVATMQAVSAQAIRRQRAAGLDVLLAPTLAQPPALVGSMRNDADPEADLAAQLAFTPFASVINATGQPAVNVPLHVSADGLPIGVMLVGRPADEVTLISLSAQLEAARPWAHRHPPIWSV
ncbi:MAG: amidase, partial [Actinomycetes bacterium]